MWKKFRCLIMNDESNFNISDWQLRQLYSRVALLEDTLQSALNDWQNNVNVKDSKTFKNAEKVLQKYEFPQR